MRILSRLTKSRSIPTLSWQPDPQIERLIAQRRYRTDVPYILPKDDRELDRLDFQHYSFKCFFRGNYFAPISPASITSILDVGCGTGRWVREMALSFPQARVIGIDLESPRLTPATPANANFAQGNILRGLPFPDQSFDLTNQRLLVGAIVAKQWPAVISELCRVTKPGGWVELIEAGEGYHNPGPATEQLLAWWRKAGPKAGFDLSVIPHLDELLVQAGLINVQRSLIPLPLGRWGERAGELLAMDMEQVCKSFHGFFGQQLGLSSAQFDKQTSKLLEEWETYHTTYDVTIVYGQKM